MPSLKIPVEDLNELKLILFLQRIYSPNFSMKKNIFFKLKRNKLAKALSILAIIVLGSTANHVFAQNWNEVIKAVASDRAVEDRFGNAVAISGDYAIVGAEYEDHNVQGTVFRDQAGAAYIFRNIAGTWTEVQKIVASNRNTGDNFGHSVAISGDYAIVGAHTNDGFISGTGNVNNSGAAYIFKNTAGVWTKVNILEAFDFEADDLFGCSVAMSGDYAMVGAWREDEDEDEINSFSDAGSVYVFLNNGGTWSHLQKIVPLDRGTDDAFGWSVSISGDYAIIGAKEDDENATGGNNLQSAGSAYIFKNTAGTWAQMQKIVASDRGTNDEFGNSVSISGDYALVGAMLEDHNLTGGQTLVSAGSSYIFKNNAGTWSQVQKIIAPDRDADDMFGSKVSISGNYALIGALNEEEDAAGANAIAGAGAAYLFENTAGTWSMVQKIVASDRGGVDDYFGDAVALEGNYAIVGAFLEDEDSTGGNTLSAAGSVYFFQNTIAVAIVANSFEKEMTISPNPNNGNFAINLGAVGENTMISITDVSGRLIDSKKFTNVKVLNLSIDQPAGIYFIAVQTDNKKVFLRLVKE
jgi:hypothetical protein